MANNMSKIKVAILCIVLVVSLIGCMTEPADTQSKRPSLTIGESIVIGKHSEDGRTESFLGIPFAQPPVGDLRWAPPVAFTHSKDTFLADNFAPACMQGSRITQWYKNVVQGFGGDPRVVIAPKVSEDCLYLNIWRPTTSSHTDDPLLPIIVYIHGGSNKAGWSYEPNYIGKNMATDGVIVISIAYRLGAFGYFSHPAFEHSNFGLLDMVEALRWINQNSIAIGGDPTRITLMGESAGAGNIDYLMAIPASKGLFSRAIHQSSGSAMSNRATKEDDTVLGIALAKKLLATEITDVAQELRQIPADTVLYASEVIYKDHYYDNAVDGQSVLEPLVDTIKAKKLHTTELLIGSNEHESLMYLNENLSVEEWLQSEANSEDIMALQLLVDHFPNEQDQLNMLSTAKTFLCPALRLAEEISGMRGHSWVYYFNRQRDGEMAATMGAYHGAELPYVFDTHDDWLPTSQVDRQLTDLIKRYWVNFATTGNPNDDDLTFWPQFTAQIPKVITLGDTIDVSTHSQAALCEFLGPRF